MDGKRIERLPEGVLEHLAKVIGDYRTGSEIAELLRIAGYQDRSSFEGTKWRFLYGLFKEFNDKPDGPLHIAKIVQTFSAPTQWIGNEAQRRQVMDVINEGLVHASLQLNEEGKIVITERRIVHAPEEAVTPKLMTVEPIFRTRGIETEQNLCFVLMPIKSQFDRLYRDKIKPTVEASGFKCLRADDIFSPMPILEDIWIHICKSRVIIADVTGRNPNVFYEMGIAHTLGKPIVILTQDKTDVPFDVAQFRYYVYSDDSYGWDVLCNSITQSLKSIFN